ncbi:MAG: hypothetical protein Q8Q23_06390 [bacterium]|nr:hypothetical protein [bacterium]
MKILNKKNIIISAHCDDALLSLGGYIIFLDNVIVVDIFGTCAWTKNTKIKDFNIITEINQAEEKEAIKKSGAKVIIYALPEALMRGYRLWNQKKILESDAIISHKISKIITAVIGSNNNIFFPMGIGNHVDHILINNQLKKIYNKLNAKDNKIFLYEDLPYAWYGDVNKKIRVLKKAWILEPYLIDISRSINKKINLIKIYKSQIDKIDCQKVVEYSESIIKGEKIERIWEVKRKNEKKFN